MNPKLNSKLSLGALASALLLVACGGGGGGGGSAPTPGEPSRGPDPFVFATAPVTAYARIDRMGGPATATALLEVRDRDEFNAVDPVSDPDFVGRQVTRLTKIHYELDDDLKALGLTLCSRDSTDITEVDVSKCVSQAAPVIVPDVLRLNLSQPDGYPNGRDFAAPVINRLLAVALLDLNVHDADTLTRSGLVTPAANDKPFPSTFPYLADPFPPP